MLTLTVKAVEQVKEAIASQDVPEEYNGVRVAVVGGGCSGFQYAMRLEGESREGDQIVDVDGFKVYVDEQSSLYLDGTQIDFVETPRGSGFRFNNPNVSGTCGCGESFKV
jgi:iron-sulfur cluster assembly protein